MKFGSAIVLALCATAGANSLYKRSAGYGDEAVTPVAVTEAAYGPPVPVTSAPVPAPVEEAPKQEYNAPVAPAPSAPSGYRKKRAAGSASYGDEPSVSSVAPVAVTEASYGAPAVTSAPAPAPVEEAPKQEYNAPVAPVQSAPSGYRKKRAAGSASYGDEPAAVVAPVTTSQPQAYGNADIVVVETTVAPVEIAPVVQPKQEYNQPEPVVKPSGYRLKRGAGGEYGDEKITPAPVTEGYGGSPPAPVTSAPAPVEQAPVVEAKPEYNAPAPVVAPSGY
uniref:Translation initiation factor IF-2 n=1 Tax=Rhabditophanes sp. KR3021 TaxID=114890 RepID=A0A1I8CET0_9BILA